MSRARTIHERLMNVSGSVLSRVGVGGGVRGGLGVRASIQDQSDNLTVGGALRAIGFGEIPCNGRHDLIFDGEPQAVEAWWRCPKCGAEA